MSALDPCPFCGSADIRRDHNLRNHHEEVFCDDCGATVSHEGMASDAIAAWNRRAPSGQATLEGVKPLINVLKEAREDVNDDAIVKRIDAVLDDYGDEMDPAGRIRSALLPASAEPVAWTSRVNLDAVKSGYDMIVVAARQPPFDIPLYTSPPASGAVEAGPDGLSEWEGWDRSRGDWSETKHKDAVLAELFGAWSMEDAVTLIGFIDRTWTKRPASPREGR